MSKAIAVKINGISFLAETDNSIEVPADLALIKGNSKRDSDFEEVIDLSAAEQSFSDVKRLIIECCSSLYEAIADIPNPEKVAIEFGIKLAGETGFPMITKASGEANFKISIEWKTATGSST
jgi:Trypsin-co-occurring domain 1